MPLHTQDEADEHVARGIKAFCVRKPNVSTQELENVIVWLGEIWLDRFGHKQQLPPVDLPAICDHLCREFRVDNPDDAPGQVADAIYPPQQGTLTPQQYERLWANSRHFVGLVARMREHRPHRHDPRRAA